MGGEGSVARTTPAKLRQVVCRKCSVSVCGRSPAILCTKTGRRFDTTIDGQPVVAPGYKKISPLHAIVAIGQYTPRPLTSDTFDSGDEELVNSRIFPVVL